MKLTRYAQLPSGPSLYYTDEGAGDTLLFVHGWACDSDDWLWQLPHFRSKYRVIAADLRGHGRSAVTQDGYEARVFARDLIELLDMLGVRTCVPIGHSLGGLIASALAVEYPERIRAAVCLEPAYGAFGEEAAGCRSLIEQIERPDWPQLVAAELPQWEGASTPSYFRELHKRRLLATDPRVVAETFLGCFVGKDPLGFRDRSETYLNCRTCPVLGLYALNRAENAIWETRRSRNGADRFVYLPLGHWVQHDAPQVVNQLIEQWLGTLPLQ
jgi:pimeloyl-ACP methyl ester carboxylesterase